MSHSRGSAATTERGPTMAVRRGTRGIYSGTSVTTTEEIADYLHATGAHPWLLWRLEMILRARRWLESRRANLTMVGWITLRIQAGDTGYRDQRLMVRFREAIRRKGADDGE